MLTFIELATINPPLKVTVCFPQHRQFEFRFLSHHKESSSNSSPIGDGDALSRLILPLLPSPPLPPSVPLRTVCIF
ncbi:unnamed protein product [Linum tenue]|uniref:Uncharacterized protein n=1 Tax=Linum tenue TaxID=586396 RepID=A0AAV0LID3_9ROSI|nr:unnamed protein product [Linum tenue]